MCSRWDFSFVHACSSARPRSHPGRFLIAPLFSAVIAERPLPTLQVIKKRKKNDRKTFTNTSATSCAGGEWAAVGHIYYLLARCFSFAQKVDFASFCCSPFTALFDGNEFCSFSINLKLFFFLRLFSMAFLCSSQFLLKTTVLVTSLLRRPALFYC